MFHKNYPVKHVAAFKNILLKLCKTNWTGQTSQWEIVVDKKISKVNSTIFWYFLILKLKCSKNNMRMNLKWSREQLRASILCTTTEVGSEFRMWSNSWSVHILGTKSPQSYIQLYSRGLLECDLPTHPKIKLGKRF